MNKIEFEWIDAYDKPKDINEPIIALTKNNKLVVFKDTISRTVGPIDALGKITYIESSNWDHLVYKYNIKSWNYQKKLIF